MDEVGGVLAELEADPAFDPGTRQRGQAYARSGRVSELTHTWSGGRFSASALVQGTGRYRTTVSAVRGPDGRLQLGTSCTCPMAYDCKHVVAVLASVRDRLPARRPDWRSVLDGVLDEASGGPVTEAGAPVPVAVELVLSTDRSYRGAGRAAARPPRAAVRALRRGSTGRWVRSGMEWSSLGNAAPAGPWPGASRGPVVDPVDEELLVELKLALLGRRGYLVTSADALDLHAAGPALWRALDRLVERGIPLLCSERTVEVRLSPAPARVEVDVRAADDAAALRAGVVADGTWFDAGHVGFVGEPPHGVLLRVRPPNGADEDGGAGLVLARLDRLPPRTVQDWLRTTAELRVERAGVDELVDEYLPALARSVPVSSRDGSVALPGPPEVRLRGEVTWSDDGRVELAWRWLYRRGDEVQQFPVEGAVAARGWRDPDAEVALVQGLGWGEELDALLSVGLRGPGTLAARVRLRDVEAMRFATVHLPRLTSHPDVEVVTNGAPPQFREATGRPEVRFRARGAAERRDRTDWLDLEVVVSVDDEQHGPLALALPRVLAALATGETVVMVRPGVFVDLDRPGLDRLARLVRDARAVADQPADGVRVSRQAHDLLADVHEIGATEGQLSAWAHASAALRGLAESEAPLPAVPLPAGLRATLRPYQTEGYGWLDFLRRHRLGGVLADDMGLGKTLQTLAMISRAREEAADDATRPFLVVAPASVVETWRSEAERFTPDPRVLTVPGATSRRGWPLSRALDPAGPADVVVTTYTLLRLEAEHYASIRWAGLVLDEAQTVKNFRSKSWAAVRDLEADCRFALTGTPPENNLMELWSILALCAPGLFPHAESFRNTIANPVEQHADPDALATLRRRLRPVLLRRTKERVATDLPAKQEQLVSVELSARHRRIYDTHLQRERQRVLQLLDDLDGNRITILASLTRLRQLSLDPALVDPVHETVGSAKIDELLDRLTEVVAEGHRTLVFSQFTGFLARVRRRLDAAGIGYAYLDGRTRNRARVVDGFRSGTAPVFLISLKAGGVGLNLAEADYCFLLDPWWNPAVEAQAVDRVHRIGQTRPVLVYRLVAADTVEQKVVQLSARKAELFRSVLDGDTDFGSRLSAADIAALVG